MQFYCGFSVLLAQNIKTKTSSLSSVQIFLVSAMLIAINMRKKGKEKNILQKSGYITWNYHFNTFYKNKLYCMHFRDKMSPFLADHPPISFLKVHNLSICSFGNYQSSWSSAPWLFYSSVLEKWASSQWKLQKDFSQRDDTTRK